MSVEASNSRPTVNFDSKAKNKRSAMSRDSRNIFIAVAFLLPNLLGFLAFTFFPVLVSFWMSFTNWSLKPAVKFEFVGLRNFIDLMGVHPITQSNPLLLTIYVACIVGFLLGGFGALWGNMEQWKGTRLGSGLIAATGVVFSVIGFSTQSDGIVLAGLVALLCGTSGAMKDTDFGVGFGAAPGFIIALSSAGLWHFQQAMTATYAPNDNYFYQDFYNTVYLMLGIPVGIAGSLGMAMLLNEQLPTGPVRERTVGAAICLAMGVVLGGIIWATGNPDGGLVCGIFWLIAALGIGFNVVVYRTLFYLPTFTAGVALMIMWKALYNPRTGPINVGLAILFHALHIHATPPQWLASVHWAKAAMILMGTWTGIGGTNMLLYLAGLSNVPKELIDAANVDGAGPWNRFRHVTWPQLAPTTFFISIMSIIGGLQGGFDQARVMTQGGPAGSTTTLTYYIYTKAFSELDMGYAAAVSWVLFLIVFVATAINWKFGKGLDSE